MLSCYTLARTFSLAWDRNRLRAVTATILGLLLLTPAHAQPATDTNLSELMLTTQFRHIKLWFAGKLGNWRLAGYELDQMQSGLDQAAKRFPAGATPDAFAAQIAALRNAIDAKNVAGFTRAYTELTNGCNACHRAAGRDFISVQVPPVSPFTDQVFPDQVAEGRNLAHVICGTCHLVPDSAAAAPTASPSPSLSAPNRPAPRFPAPSFAALAARPSFTETSLRQLLASNHRWIGADQAMPNPRLSESQIEEMVAYFEALKAQQKR